LRTEYETFSQPKIDRERFCADSVQTANGHNLPTLPGAFRVAAMKKPMRVLAALALLGTASLAGTAQAAEIDCKLKFTMSGWSVFYKRADGTGTITCNNGQSAAVKLSARGGGLTAGKSTIRDGTGEFSGVHSIDDLFGSYASAEAHAGAVKSSKAQAMTKGEVSLALAGTGDGWDLGIAFGKFTIKRQ
jgi:hypothetical protein